jgi:hypothetical protein
LISFNSRTAWAAIVVDRANDSKMNKESSDALASDLAKAEVLRLISFSHLLCTEIHWVKFDRTSNIAAGSLTTASGYSYDQNNSTKISVGRILPNSNRRIFLHSPRREQLGKFAAIEPDAAAIRAGVDNHRFLNRAVDTQQLSRIPRADTFFAIEPFVLAAAAQQPNLFGVFGQKLA